ncbi:protein kinase [candidate division CSSED10-310 bacterium]|uniref:Protein kinase n=1 Tax=candidate division CSSED10-310 bacterium TaxID=2855610 RepID=A0ABV6YTS3_UNCC1
MKEKIVKGYRIKRMIGKGGMAAIYLAEHIASKEEVALKVLLSHIASDRDYVLRFLHEVRANKKLHHKNIVKIIDCDEVKGHYFMAMEYMDGFTLQQLLKKVPILPVPCALYILREILEGLLFSHSKNIIHRDMKPSNILISKSGLVKISDFGISKITEFTKLTQTGSVLGTPAYMSPEQAKGHLVDFRSDIFSAGVMFYETILGENPFASDNPTSAILNILQKTPQPAFELNPTLSTSLEIILENMMEKDQEQRYGAVEAILEDLNQLERDEGAFIDQKTFQAFIQNPDQVSQTINQKEADRILAEASKIVIQGETTENQAIWEYYKVLYLDPDNVEAQRQLTQLCTKQGYNVKPDRSNKIIQLEKTLAENPGNVAVLMQLAKLHRLAGNFFEVIYYYKRLKKLKPNDGYIQVQIESLIGDKTLARQVTVGQWDAKTASQYGGEQKTQYTRGQKTQYTSGQKTIPRYEVTTVAPKKMASKKAPIFIFWAVIIGVALLVFWGIFSMVKSIKPVGISTQRELKPFIITLDQIESRLEKSDFKSLGSESKALYELAEKSFENKDYQKARELYTSLVKKSQEKLKNHILFRLALIEKNLDNYEEALTHIDTLMDSYPEPRLEVFAQKERAQIYSIQGQNLDAEVEYDDILMKLDNVPQIEYRVQCILDYANFLRALRKYQKALQTVTIIIDDYSGSEFHFAARKVRATIFLELNEKKEAFWEYQQILENLSPENAEYQDIKSMVAKLKKQVPLKDRSSAATSEPDQDDSENLDIY